MRALVATLLLAGLVFVACDDGGDGDDSDGGGTIDAAPGGADAAPGGADAAPGAVDAGPGGPDAFPSICGQPGDVGNEMGIGKFCTQIGDCLGTPAPLCAVLGDPMAHFCTKTCANSDAGPAVCGTAASCVCGGGGCGCTPDSCL